MNCVKLSSLKERERKKERECFVLVSDFLCVCFLSPFALELYFPGLLHIHFICSHIISFPVAEQDVCVVRGGEREEMGVG